MRQLRLADAVVRRARRRAPEVPGRLPRGVQGRHEIGKLVLALVALLSSCGGATTTTTTAPPQAFPSLAFTSTWAAKEHFAGNPRAVAGAKLFVVAGCFNCHTYLGTGGRNLGAPDLSAEGAKHKGMAFQVAHLKCPPCATHGSQMPSFAGLGDARLKTLAAFLEASKGAR